MAGAGFIAIGDIHGRLDYLRLLLDRVQADKVLDDSVPVFLGDMIDRGPQSCEVVSTIKEMVDGGQAVALLGNHEDMMLSEVRSGDWRGVSVASVWKYNGGGKTIESYGGTWPKKDQWLRRFCSLGHHAWLDQLPLFYETDHIWFSHAPVSVMQAPHLGLYRAARNELLWNTHHEYQGMSEECFAAVLEGKRQVVGHVHALFQKIVIPRVYPHIIYADTGCGCADWGPLCAVVLEEGGRLVGYYLVTGLGTVVYERSEE